MLRAQRSPVTSGTTHFLFFFSFWAKYGENETKSIFRASFTVNLSANQKSQRLFMCLL